MRNRLNNKELHQRYFCRVLSESWLWKSVLNGKWYAYFQSSLPSENDTYTRKAHNFVAVLPNSDGMATSDTTNISNNLLRNNATTPTPGTYGTPYPVLSAPKNQFEKITPGPDDWYNRMRAISTNYVEIPGAPTPPATPLPIRIHAFIHTEDTHDVYGDTYGIAYNNASGAHACISRIGYMRSLDAINFTPVNASVSVPTSSPMPTIPAGTPSPTPFIGPVIECFMKELDWVYPTGTPAGGIPTPTPGNTPVSVPTHPELETSMGVRHPNLAERGDYFYLFYDRNLSRRYVEVRVPITPIPTTTPTPHADTENLKKSLIQRYDGSYYVGPSICVARALKSDVLAYNPAGSYPNNMNPWKNYYNDGNTNNDGFNKLTMGHDNWSSPVVIPGVTGTDPIKNPYRETPSVSFNTYLNTYVMLCKGRENDIDWTFFLHLPLNDSLTKWSYGLRIDAHSVFTTLTNEKIQYPYLINNDEVGGNRGSFMKSGQINWLYFNNVANLPTTAGAHRTGFKFVQ